MDISDPYIFGRPQEYNVKLLLKLILYAISREVFPNREMERMAEEELPARWLTQEAVPSYRTICRFRISDELNSLLNHGFEVFREFLKDNHLIDIYIFVDGTKILADATKYSFVWKKNTVRYDEINRQQIQNLLTDLRQAYGNKMIPESKELAILRER